MSERRHRREFPFANPGRPTAVKDIRCGRGEGVTLMQLLDFAAKYKFEGFDATGYFFPGYPAVAPDAYIDGLRKKAADLGIGISGTGFTGAGATTFGAASKCTPRETNSRCPA